MDEEDAGCTEVQELTKDRVDKMTPSPQNQVAISPKRDMVKSTAVVKWSATQFPLQFSQLSLNTNLNEAPDNWLRSETREQQHLRDLPWQRQHSECSSFAMAHCYPDYAGEVDVVSAAENIKRLLKIPYENSHASLIVHRVGRTLLLDSFDIHKHLLRQESENWTWLKEFFKNTVMKSEDEIKCVPRPVKSQAVLQDKRMYSKFLYKSLKERKGQETEVSQVERHHHVSPSHSPSPVVQHFVADRLPAIDYVQYGDSEFRRQMLWTFEDLRMLIGTDLPVFSVGDHPCVSIRLRESSQPVNVVTGLEFWLDNLMCNVPEVAMCYHDRGFVQKYELIKTEDIPRLQGCGFDPREVKDVATNILSFLRNSATKEGHTYWLYKRHRSDIIKLYDLTTLCDKTVPNQGVTPFTIPVAMLLYRVGRKMHVTGKQPNEIPQIKALLQTCLGLLDEVEHAEVCTSSYYLLSDLYVPDSCLRNVWVEEGPDDSVSEQSSESEEEGEEESQAEFSVSVKDLMDAPKGNLQAPRRARLEGITGMPDERCRDGLQCLRKGLSCLESDLKMKARQDEHSSSSIVEEQRTCNSNEAIPLRYEPLRQPENACHSTVLVQRSSLRKDPLMSDSWHSLSKALLLRKASMANYVLATEFLANKQSGTAMKHVRYAVHCFESMATLKPSKREENHFLLMLILLTTSEVRHHLAISNSFEEHQRGYNDMSEEDAYILDCAQNILSVPELAWVYEWTTNRCENLRISLRCLEIIKDLSRNQPQTLTLKELMQDVTKKTSAILNELGKVYMTQTENKLSNGATFEDIESIWTKSLNQFEKGIDGFRKVKDSKNEAIIILNIVRLHKIAAHAYRNTQDTNKNIMNGVRRHFGEACECFKSALQCLHRGHRQIRNNILWDFSSTYLNFGMLLQQYPTASDRNTIYKEVEEMYRKAMKKCQQIEVMVEDPLWVCCKDRLATLEFNMAEMHVDSYFKQTTQRRVNAEFLQAEDSFKKAVELFTEAEKCYKLLQVQCIRLGFHISHYQSSDYPDYNTIVQLIIDCKDPLHMLEASDFHDDSSIEKIDGDAQDPLVLLEYLLKPLLTACHQLLKRATRLHMESQQQKLKDLYKRCLAMQNQLTDKNLTFEHKFPRVVQLVTHIAEQYADCVPL